MLARALGALGAVAFGVAVVAGLLVIWYRVPQGCDTCDDPSVGAELVHWTYIAVGFIALWLGVIAARQSGRCAQGRGGGSGAVVAGAASLCLYGIWFVAWEWVAV